jgi:hypothetical protein
MEKKDVVEQWLEAMSAGSADKNRSEHKQNFQMFLDFTGKSAQQILAEYSADSKKQFKNTYSKLLLDFTAHLQQQNFEPIEVRKKVDSARLFFKHNNLPLGFGARAHLQFLFK